MAVQLLTKMVFTVIVYTTSSLESLASVPGGHARPFNPEEPEIPFDSMPLQEIHWAGETPTHISNTLAVNFAPGLSAGSCDRKCVAHDLWPAVRVDSKSQVNPSEANQSYWLRFC